MDKENLSLQLSRENNNNIPMGAQQQSPSQLNPLQQSTLVYQSTSFKTYASKTGHLYNLHRVQDNGSHDFLQQYEYRINNKRDYFVNAYFIDQIKNTFSCHLGGVYDVLVDAVDLRLSMCKSIDGDQAVSVFATALKGFGVLFMWAGEFSIKENMITFTKDNKVKVWVNERFELNWAQKQPYEGKRSNQQWRMMNTLLELINKKVTNSITWDKFVKWWRQTNPKKFSDAIPLTQDYISTNKVQKKWLAVTQPITVKGSIMGEPSNGNINEAASMSDLFHSIAPKNRTIPLFSSTPVKPNNKLISNSTIRETKFSSFRDKILYHSVQSQQLCYDSSCQVSQFHANNEMRKREQTPQHEINSGLNRGNIQPQARIQSHSVQKMNIGLQKPIKTSIPGTAICTSSQSSRTEIYPKLINPPQLIRSISSMQTITFEETADLHHVGFPQPFKAARMLQHAKRISQKNIQQPQKIQKAENNHDKNEQKVLEIENQEKQEYQQKKNIVEREKEEQINQEMHYEDKIIKFSSDQKQQYVEQDTGSANNSLDEQLRRENVFKRQRQPGRIKHIQKQQIVIDTVENSSNQKDSQIRNSKIQQIVQKADLNVQKFTVIPLLKQENGDENKIQIEIPQILVKQVKDQQRKDKDGNNMSDSMKMAEVSQNLEKSISSRVSGTNSDIHSSLSYKDLNHILKSIRRKKQ